MNLTDQLAWCIEAQKWMQANSVTDLLAQSKQTIEKLEQDRKVLRWALLQARDALSGLKDTYYNHTILSVIDTATSMTEPANDR